MRVLVLTHEYPPVGGGGGRVAQDLCAGLARRGHTVEVLTARWGNLPAVEEQAGVNVRRVRSLRRSAYQAKLGAMGGYVAAAISAGLGRVRAFQPDVIHVHFAVPAGAAAYALHRMTGVPYVLTAHLGDVPGGVPDKTGGWFKAVYPLTPPIWRAAAARAAVSSFTRSLAQSAYPGLPVEVIPNGVDLAALPARVERRPGEPVRLLFAGRLTAQKNPLAVIQALAGLVQLPWTCVLAGDGPLRAAVEAEIALCGLRERVKLSGWLQPEQVLERMAASDVLFMPSLSEGLPVVGVQAVGLGLALAVSTAPGWDDLAGKENSVRCGPLDVPGWQAALAGLLGDEQRLGEMQSASRALALRFDLERVVDRYEALLEEIALDR